MKTKSPCPGGAGIGMFLSTLVLILVAISFLGAFWSSEKRLRSLS